MFTNYSQTYAATITTFAGIIGVYANKFGYTNSDIELFLSTIVCFGGIVWQFLHRKSKGGITVFGARK